MNRFFVEQMAMYSAYHRNARNRATHFIGIPMIVFSLYVPLAWAPLYTSDGFILSLGMLVFVAVALFYRWLDRELGSVMALVLLALLLAGEWVARQGSGIGWAVFAIAFVGGWVFQLVGHVFEGRRPALADNLLQALVAPMFLAAEVAFALGLRRDLHDALEARWPAYAAKAPASKPSVA